MVFFRVIFSEKILYMKKFITISVIIFYGLSVYAHNTDYIKNTLNMRIKFYPLYYNSLQLTGEQVSEFEYIFEIYNEKYNQAILNNKKIDTKAINKISQQENKDIKKILDRRQKHIFSLIRHLERQDIKRALKEKDYYKSNPRMSVFGDLDKK